jgi:ParB family chromosome partitioning protein
MTQEELAEQVGKSRPAITNAMRLLELPAEVLTLVASGELSAGAARTLLGLKSRDDISLLAQRAVEEDLSVRVLEEEVKRMNKPKKEEPEDEPLPIVDYFRELELRMQTSLGRRVEIKGKGRKKTITLTYEDNEDLDEILKLLCGDNFLEEI